MAEPPTYVVDASVAVKWVLQLPDEAHSTLATNILRDFEEDRIRLIAPDYIRAELGNAVLRAVRQRRITLDQGERGLERVLALGIELIRNSGLFLGAWQLAQRYTASYYDAGYLAVAVMSGRSLVHADARLRNALHRQFPHELW